MNAWKRLDERLSAGKGRTLWQFVKFNLVSLTVTILQLLLANLLPLAFDRVVSPLPPLLRGIFRADALFPDGSKYVVNGVVTWGYVLPFLLANGLANIYGYFINMKTTFRGKGTRAGFAVYLVILFALILFATWMQGEIVAAMASSRIAPLSRTLASFGAGVVQTAVLFPLEKLVLFRQRPDVVDSDSRVNAALTRVRRYNWGKVWIALAWLSALLAVSLWIFRESALGFMVSTLLYTLLILYICLRAEFAARRAQERLTRESGPDYVDEDEFWLWGMVYYNPNDRRAMINDRTGMGMSMNLARPAGKITMGLVALILVIGVPLAAVWLVAIDFTPRGARIEDGALYFHHFTERYEIPLDEVGETELLYELPRAARVAGTGMDTLCEGRFDVEGYENVRISLDPGQDRYIVVLTEGGLTRIFNLMSAAETEAFYAELAAAL